MNNQYTEEYFRQRVIAGDVFGILLIGFITFICWLFLLIAIVNKFNLFSTKKYYATFIVGFIPYFYFLYKLIVFWTV